jgi:hypothetical protein
VDVETGKGIAGINIYLDGRTYVSNATGMVFIKGKKLKGKIVSINRDIKGYTTPNFSMNCTFKQDYEIVDKSLLIQLEKFRLLKLIFKQDEESSEFHGCSRLTSIEACKDANIAFEFVKTSNSFEVPGIPGWDEKQNFISFYMHKNTMPWLLELFYNSEIDCSYTSVLPDQIYEITMDPGNDTTYYTVQLK